jgi:hypothetical protein
MSATPNGYARLQGMIDKVVGKIGLDRTNKLLENFLGEKPQPLQNNQARAKMITDYVIGLAVELFELDMAYLFVSEQREYRDGRMCCFHLLKKYTTDSYARIGLSFQCSERSVMYGRTKTDEHLEFPKGNPDFVNRYNLMESRLIDFMTQFN